MTTPSTSTRELSCFFARELFPLYLEDQIDPHRKAQVAQHLKTCATCRARFEILKKARDEVSVLAETQVAPQMVEYLKAEHHFWVELAQQWGWKKWPGTAQWLTQLTGVALVLILTIHFFPWISLVNNLKKMKPAPVVADLPQPVPAASEPPTEVATEPADEPSIKPQPKLQANSKVASPTEAKSAPQPEPQKAAANSPAASPTIASAPSTVAAVATDGDESLPKQKDVASNDEEDMGRSSDNGVKGQGYVWRGSLKVEELTDDVANRVTKTIEDLGGTKAGQVELGWHRGKQRYYHFILPEENYEKLLSVLNGEGLVQLTKEKHARVIKQGHMRVIMTMDEAAE